MCFLTQISNVRSLKALTITSGMASSFLNSYTVHMPVWRGVDNLQYPVLYGFVSNHRELQQILVLILDHSWSTVDCIAAKSIFVDRLWCSRTSNYSLLWCWTITINVVVPNLTGSRRTRVHGISHTTAGLWWHSENQKYTIYQIQIL